MAEGKEQKKGKGFWSVSRILLLFFLVLGIIIGIAIEHYFVEKAISAERENKCNACFENQQLLNDTINSCISEKKALQKKLSSCS